MNGPGEEVLSGGYSTPVVRVEDTVRRTTGPWSPAVHGLLRHLERRGFDGAPRFLGLDDNGREILTFIPGEVGNYPLPPHAWSDETLVHAARLLRRYHDATVGYAPPDDALWQLQAPSGPREVICHNDFAPYNLVFDGPRPLAIIDFDTAGPGPRVWDVSYAVYRFVPLSSEEHSRELGLPAPVDTNRRLRTFCDVYGLTAVQRRSLPEIVERRLEALCAFIERAASTGSSDIGKVIEEGHLAVYRRAIELLRLRRDDLRKGLGRFEDW
ncbi:MAG: aminoglycoside phosphotransferase family protein [Rubrobacter sp.]